MRSETAPRRARYQAHCLWCGRDAPADGGTLERCPRCGGRLFREIDLTPRLAVSLPRLERGTARRRQRARTQTVAV